MTEQLGPRAALKQLRDDLPQIREALRELPGVIKFLSEQIANGDLKLDMRAPELQEIRDQLKEQQKQRFTLTIAGSALVSGVLVLALTGIPWLGWSLVLAGVVAAIAGRPRP